MSWAVVEHKVSFLKSALNDWERLSFEREFCELTKSGQRYARMSRSLRGVLFIDLAYAVVRHRDWLQTPVFNALLVEFLQLDHGVPKADAEVLVHDLISAGEQLGIGRSRTICNDDREFLTWAYICAAGAADEDVLEADLGLGTTLLTRLRDGISALERVDHSVFVPEYDAMLATIVMELAHESKTTPWAMDIHKLKFFLLRAVGDAAQPYILEEALPLVFDGLIATGQGESEIFADRPALNDALISAGLLREAHGARRKKGAAGYQLTDLGFRLTGGKFAQTARLSGDEPEFACLNGRWQLAMARGSNALTSKFLSQVLRDNFKRLAPDVVEAILIRLYNDGSDEGVSGKDVAGYLRLAEFGWHKAAVFRALRAMRPTRDLLDVVASELSEAISPGVRMAASSLLDSWTDPGSQKNTH